MLVSKNLAGGFGPDKWPGGFVVGPDVLIESQDEFPEALEHSTLEPLSRQRAEPALDHVEPAARRRRKVQVKARMRWGGS